LKYQRGSAASRGYGARWRKYRLAYLAAHPLCVMCAETKHVTEATVVDHIQAHKGDEMLFWDPANHQALCKPCHDRHAQRRDRGTLKPRISVDGWPVQE
jgi:5-methylcytosine-specific restriction protein A